MFWMIFYTIGVIYTYFMFKDILPEKFIKLSSILALWWPISYMVACVYFVYITTKVVYESISSMRII